MATTHEAPSDQKMNRYSDFWLFYLNEHSQPMTRYFHYWGTTFGLIFFTLALFLKQPLFLLYGLLSGYFFAWISHVFIEKNKPATFKYPLWSFISDFRMYFLWIVRKLDTHLSAAKERYNRNS